MALLLVTGGAGFIGSCYVLSRCYAGDTVVNLDKLTYSGNLGNFEVLRGNPKHIFVHGDIGNVELVEHLLKTYQPDAVVNFAAESHVDRSIIDPEAFVRTNVLGTCTLLRTTKTWWKECAAATGLPSVFSMSPLMRYSVRCIPEIRHLPKTPPTVRTVPIPPPRPPATTLSGHFTKPMVSPTLITNCSNNYGPRQFPEKLIPLVTLNALARKTLPVYGTGSNIRDWLHVEDHCDAIQRVLEHGRVGQTYNVGGNSERTNLQVVHGICAVLDDVRPSVEGSYTDLIRFVTDRPGHDFRYAINSSKLNTELNWHPTHTFEDGLRETVQWYLDNEKWVKDVQSGEYRSWMQTNYAGRLQN